MWADKTAILAGKRNIKLQNPQIAHEGRVISVDMVYKNLHFQFTNVYAPPNSTDRRNFFENWSPLIITEKINILADDFNTNLDPSIN